MFHLRGHKKVAAFFIKESEDLKEKLKTTLSEAGNQKVH